MKSLWEKRLKIAQYEDLNDPFELQPFTQTKEKQREIAQLIKKILSEKHGILCFSTF